MNDERWEWTAGLELRETNAVLSLSNSIVEVAITLFIVLIRTANGIVGYKKIRSDICFEQDFDPDSEIHVRRLRRLLILYLVAGALLFTIALTSFFVFLRLHVFHLGWTILTNNFCLTTMLVLWTMYTTMIDVTATKIREDQFKVCDTSHHKCLTLAYTSLVKFFFVNHFIQSVLYSQNFTKITMMSSIHNY